MRAFSDRTFEFDVKTPRTSYFLKKAAGLDKGSATPGRLTVGRLSVKEIYEIAKVRRARAAALCPTHQQREPHTIAQRSRRLAGPRQRQRAGGIVPRNFHTPAIVLPRRSQIKQTDAQIARSMSLEGICRSIAAQCKSVGIVVYDPRTESS